MTQPEAQSADALTVQTPQPIWPGTAPGSENAKQVEVQHELGGPVPNLVVRNVTRPTLTAYLPEPGKANGAAVIIAPGGGFMFLSVNSEGADVARRLAAQGIAAFVLKYRLQPTSPDRSKLRDEVIAEFVALSNRRGAEIGHRLLERNAFAVEDVRQAMRVVRQNATEWKIDPSRVGLLGFSAGAFAISGSQFSPDASVRPDFVGLIYGGAIPEAATPGKSTPPSFIAFSGDDELVGGATMDTAMRLRAAGASVELHLFRRGGHGYGANVQGMSSDRWFEEFLWWLQDLNVMRK